MAKIIEFVYKWDDGREEVRYRRPEKDPETNKMISEIYKLQERGKLNGYQSPYFYRRVED